ncbi:MAG: aminoacyl-tRNA hydrolase [Mariniblastus sp.]
MKLIVGLGNPGKKYQQTRHNIGFDIIACLAKRYNVERPKAKFNAEVAETIVKNEKTILLSPLTFMNLSGQSVRAAVDFYKLPLTDILVICDDINLDLARLRFRPGGSAGGQNGLKDIINRLGTQTFDRLRVGVGKVPPQWDAADFVLGKFSKEDQNEIEFGIVRAADAVEAWVENGIQSAMNKFNADPNKKPKNKPKKQIDDTKQLGASDSKPNRQVDNKNNQNPTTTEDQ